MKRFLQAILVSAILSITQLSYGQERVTLALNNADIMDLIRWAQDLTSKTILVHPAVKGKISVIAGDPMTRGEAFEVFLSVLDINGFTAIRSDSSIRVVPKNAASSGGLPFAGAENQTATEEYQVRLVPIKHISAKQIASSIQTLIPEGGGAIAYPPTNSLILIGRYQAIKQIQELIEELDINTTIDIDTLPIQFANAKEVSEIVESLIKKNQQDTDIHIAVDERSNTLFISGDPYARQQVASIVERLDQPLSGSGNTRVIKLTYASAEALLPILSSVTGSEQENKKDSIDKSTAVSIQADNSLNALIVTAPPSLLNTLKGVIAELDVRRAQVMVEAVIVEVNEDLSDSFGIRWKTALNSDSEFAGGFDGYPANLSPMSVNGNDIDLGTAFSLGYLANLDLRAVLNVLRGEANANILSTPRVMALDNEEAQILVGENVPFVTGSEKRAGDTDRFQTIERQDIGVSLKITPKINDKDSVTLNIEQKVESIGNTDAQTADIITKKREIKTRVIVENGQTLVLGGLMRDETLVSESRVPGLSSIPILGRLFRSTTSSTIKRNLMVFIRPIILSNQEAATDLSKHHYEDIRSSQEDFLNRKDLPIYPRVDKGRTLEPYPLPGAWER